jgi:ABC-type xylose transport system substrate-binding protein
VTGQDAEKASVQYIIDGKQSMTVFKDVRTLVNDAIAAAVALLKGRLPPPRARTTMARLMSRHSICGCHRGQRQRQVRADRLWLLFSQ